MYYPQNLCRTIKKGIPCNGNAFVRNTSMCLSLKSQKGTKLVTGEKGLWVIGYG